MPGSVDRPPDLVAELRTMKSRLSELEQGQMHGALNAPWQTPTLLNSFANWGSGYAPVGYYTDSVGRVYLRGAVSVPASPITTIFTLAAGYRPAYIHDFFVAGEYADDIAQSIITVDSTGAVQVARTDVGLAGKITLDSVQFRVF